MIRKSYSPIELFEGLGYDQNGDIYVFNPVKFVDDLKDKDDPELEKAVLMESYGSRDFPIIERIILDTREKLNKVEVFE